jgi:hypothetical protein
MDSKERQAVARRMIHDAIDSEQIGATHLREGMLLALDYSETSEDIVFWLLGYFGLATEFWQVTGGITVTLDETSPKTSS